MVAFEVMIGHNSRTDRTKESLKTFLDSEDSNRSDELKNVPLNLKYLEKCEFLIFRKLVFHNYPIN